MSEKLEQTEGTLEQIGELKLQSPKEFQQAEWCFQFFDSEPVVFAWSQSETEPGTLVLEVKPTENSGLTFVKDGMEFKLFARELTEVGKQMREEQNNARQD